MSHLPLAPWILFSYSLELFPGQNLLLTIIISTASILGAILNKSTILNAASMALLASLLTGKLLSDVLKLSQPETATLLVQFVSIILVTEASKAAITFDKMDRDLRSRTDEVSQHLMQKLVRWVQRLLLDQTRVSLASIGLSLGLIIVAGFVAVSINQLIFSAMLVMVAIAVLLFLLTHRREPDVNA